jgi:thiamine pyrophosphate-dependent acetolactate synthase large subunit-like protein
MPALERKRAMSDVAEFVLNRLAECGAAFLACAQAKFTGKIGAS